METEKVLSHVAAANDAATALDEHLHVLLAVVDIFRVQGREAASREMQHVLARAIRVLHVLQKELACLQTVERFVRRTSLPS